MTKLSMRIPDATMALVKQSKPEQHSQNAHLVDLLIAGLSTLGYIVPPGAVVTGGAAREARQAAPGRKGARRAS